MSNERAERFVSQGFKGVTLIKSETSGPSLLAKRAPKRSGPGEAIHSPIVGKTDIVDAVASSAGLTKDQAKRAVESVFEAISAALHDGKDVRLIGFGKFSANKRKAGTDRNARTGKLIAVRPLRKLKFAAGKRLLDVVNDEA